MGTFIQRGYEIWWNWKLGQGVRLFGKVRFELIVESDRGYGSYARYVYLAQHSTYQKYILIGAPNSYQFREKWT